MAFVHRPKLCLACGEASLLPAMADTSARIMSVCMQCGKRERECRIQNSVVNYGIFLENYIVAGRTRKLPAHDAWSWAVTCRIGRTCGQHLTDSLTSLEVAQGKAFSDRLTFDHGGSRTGCRSSSAPFHGQEDPAFFLPNQSIRETSWWQTMCGGVERPCASWGFVKEVVTPVSRFYLYVWWPEMQLRPLRILRKTSRLDS